MAKAASTTLLVNRGTTFTIDLLYKKAGVAATLVGATVRFTVKEAEWDSDDDDSTAVVTKNVTTGTSGGSATIALAPVDTAEVDPGEYFYDIKVEEAGGAVYKIVEGKFILDGSPTNRLS
jgi:hypothetical protein